MKSGVLAAVWLISSFSLGAETLQNGLAATDAAAQLQKANTDIAQIRLQRETLLRQLQSIEIQYGTTAGSLRELSFQIHHKRQQLGQLSVQINKQQLALQQQQALLSKQINTAFVMGRKEKLKLLLNQQDPALASRMMVYYDYLNRARLKKLTAIQEGIVKLAKLQQAKHQTSESLDQAIESDKIQRADLIKARTLRDTLLARLKMDFKLKSQALTQLEENEQKIEALIQSLQHNAQASVTPTPSQTNVSRNVFNPVDKFNPLYATAADKAFASLKGHLHWPVKGAIIRKFGSRRSDTRWDGVLIGAPEGAEVYAVSSGQVVFANWLRGYGLLTIIDHGQGYMTLYAFNQSLYKKVGDKIKAGTAIAAVGKSDGRDEAGLYFGIRNHGKAINPVTWCK